MEVDEKRDINLRKKKGLWKSMLPSLKQHRKEETSRQMMSSSCLAFSRLLFELSFRILHNPYVPEVPQSVKMEPWKRMKRKISDAVEHRSSPRVACKRVGSTYRDGIWKLCPSSSPPKHYDTDVATAENLKASIL